MSESSTDARLVDEAVEAIEAGRPVVLPTDTVYGLCARPDAAATLARLKGRDDKQPLTLLAADVDTLFGKIPELRDQATVVRTLLPGRLTLILPNPAHRYDWLTGDRHDAIGVRVPELEGAAREIVERVGAVAATSANLHGGPDPRRLEEIPDEIRQAAVLVDGGELPGAPSTVVDLTGDEPKILREGAVPAGEVLERVASARG
ncbi:MAG TPA: L-threonylcarbamoyladenylate synthase [Gaiellaceae bacterium]|nr:L-threonylcarbamoyladenylate synthase [Gaiellaceae bacterium]